MREGTKIKFKLLMFCLLTAISVAGIYPGIVNPFDQSLDTDDSPTFVGLTVSSLTSGRVVYAGASGLLQDSANLTFDGANLDVAGTGDFGTLVVGSGSIMDASVLINIYSSGNTDQLKVNTDGTINMNRGNLNLPLHSVVIGTGANLTTYGATSLLTNANPYAFDNSVNGFQFLDAVTMDSTLGVTGVTTLTGLIYPSADGSSDDIITTDGAGTLSIKTATVDIPIVLTMFDAVPSRAKVSNWNGGLSSLITGQQLGPTSPGDDISVSKGIGEIVIVVNAGTDLAGDITVTGESINRDTGASTGADTDTVTIDALTTDSSTTDSNGNVCPIFVGAYITSKWFTGTVVLSSTTLNLSDVDVYNCSFEQWNDQSNLTLNTFDVNLFTTGVNAEFDAYLQTLHVTGDKCNIDCEAELHLGADGETAIADKYWRLRRGGIDKALDGTTDGMWVQIFYSNVPVQVEDVTAKVWATKSQTLTLN